MIEIKQSFDINDDISSIRQEVFIDEQHISYVDEFEGEENLFVHFCLYFNDCIIGYIRGSIDSKILHIGRVAIIKKNRKHGFGKILMFQAEKFGYDHFCESVTLNAQLQAKCFYRKLGYTESGAVFQEAGIPHIKMTKSLKDNI